jgi:predicted small secreted protein
MKKTDFKTELLLIIAALVIMAAVLTSCFPVRPASSIRYCPPVRGSR